MTQIHEPPSRRTERIEPGAYQPGGFETARERSSPVRTAAIALMLVAVTLVAAGVGFLLAGGRLPSSGASPTPAPSAAEAKTPAAQPAVSQPAPTAPQAPASAPKPESTAPPAPTVAPTVAPTTPPKPTEPPPPTAAPKPTAAPSKPAAERPAPAAQQGAHVPVRPGIDPRMAQIEGRVHEYFAALGERDFARAQQVCCTPEWRARYPVDRWERNFDGVTDLRLAGPPRYLRVEDEIVIVDTDYTFLSGGVRRNFTIRWTFKPVGAEWQADIAEAFPTR